MSRRSVHRSKFRAKGLCSRLECTRLTGLGPTSLSFLPDDQMRPGMDTETVALLPVLRRIEVLVGSNGTTNCLSGLRLLLEHLNTGPFPPADQMETAASPKPQAINEKIALKFVEEGGIRIVLTLLLVGGGNVLVNPLPVKDAEVKQKEFCLDVLCQLCLLNSGISDSICEIDELVIYCFHLLKHAVLYNKACQLIEHILMAKKTTFNLCVIPNLQKMLMTLEGGRLASFCKILAITVSDLDIYEHKSSLYQQNIQKRSEDFVPVRDINQELVLSVPGLLSKLVDHATRLPYNPRFPSTPSEIDHWMRFIDDHISDELALGEVMTNESYPGGFVADPCTSLVDDLTDRVEVLYILGLLLVGKQRKQVQHSLADLQLIPKLSSLFDSFIWRSNGGRQRSRLPGHNQGCECSPEIALKIQLLRLIHSFCDHSEYKHLLMSRCEWNELGRIPPSPAPAVLRLEACDGGMVVAEPVFPPPNPLLMCRGSRGLLTKIVEVLKKEPSSSTHRFWLSRAVESYLRGGTSHQDQVFLLRRGLLQHITASLIQTDSRHKETIQSSFDLLGEMVKFSFEACRQMDAILNTESKLKKAMTMVNNNLIDSNMFIRAMVLAAGHFISAGGEPAEFARQSRLMKNFREFEKHVKFVVHLVSILKVTDLTQENVSCLNTSLVILMLARRDDKLPCLLHCLVKFGNSLLSNLRCLLKFWQEHYLHKDKDCSTLEKSSLIPFSFWKSTVSILVSDDENSPSSILFYIKGKGMFEFGDEDSLMETEEES